MHWTNVTYDKLEMILSYEIGLQHDKDVKF